MRRSVGIAAVLLMTLTAGIAVSRVHAKKTRVQGVEWYASFSDALAEAKQTHKPILLLSMFGRLDEDMPCANARTLRATLFKDPDFQALITKDLIPAWEMVRPVPHITIDLGNGTKITRTVRGNAVMYLCNPDGLVVDAFPGIYTAKDFLPMIRQSMAALTTADAAAVLKFHKDQERAIPMTLTTMSKAVMESPTLEMIGAPKFIPPQTPAPNADPARAAFLIAAKRLSDFSLTPMQPQEVVTAVTGEPIDSVSHEQLVSQILANDSATNMRRVRPVIHYWMASLKQLPTPEEARDAVLGTILKIPYKDPYLGLKEVIMPGTPG